MGSATSKALVGQNYLPPPPFTPSRAGCIPWRRVEARGNALVPHSYLAGSWAKLLEPLRPGSPPRRLWSPVLSFNAFEPELGSTWMAS